MASDEFTCILAPIIKYASWTMGNGVLFSYIIVVYPNLKANCRKNDQNMTVDVTL